VLLGIASGFALFHIATDGRYGFHRDELQFLSDARHLAWGYVSYPPLTPLIEHLSLGIFGLSLIGLRLCSVIAQALLILAGGLMARELGGGRLAEVTTALAVALSGLPIFEATEFQYSSFDMLWWVLIAYFTIRLLKSDNPRWWLAIGAVVGLGLLTKYSIVFYIAGVLTGVVFTRARRFVATSWFWGGIALALLIFLPNFIWLVRHQFISYHFLQHIHTRDVGEGRAEGFIEGQFLYCVNVFAAPVWIAGLFFYLRDGRYRMLAWMYIVPVGLFFVGKGRFYYVAAAYPMLLAAGSVAGERWLRRLPRWGRFSVETIFFTGLSLTGAYLFAMLVPIASSGPLKDFALDHSGDLREEFGWNELVRTVAGIRDSLPPDQQASLGIVVGNYGEQGAIEIFGPAYRLPPPISTTNSAWLRGYPTPAPTTLIVLGVSKKKADGIFTGCRIVGHNDSQGVHNEESQYNSDILLCGPPRQPWPDFWRDHQSFG
jgi:hypothetical protein